MRSEELRSGRRHLFAAHHEMCTHFEEMRWAQVLGEHICNVALSGHKHQGKELVANPLTNFKVVALQVLHARKWCWLGGEMDRRLVVTLETRAMKDRAPNSFANKVSHQVVNVDTFTTCSIGSNELCLAAAHADAFMLRVCVE